VAASRPAETDPLDGCCFNASMRDAVIATVVVLLALGWLLKMAATYYDARNERAHLARRMAGVERQLKVINERLGIAPAEPDLGGVLQHLAEDRYLTAIKEYREVTNAGLAEAKAAVDRLREERRA
jgi:hypothetical protein